jgi:hypothetical protein
MVSETGGAGPGAGLAPARPGDPVPFCGYDTGWEVLPVRLTGRSNQEYGGLTLFGPCPRCRHPDGINVFIPTTWASLAAVPAAAGPAPGGPVVRVAAYAHLAAVAVEPAAGWQVIEWEPDRPPPGGPAQPGAGGRPGRSGAARRPGPPQPDLVEVISCQCGLEASHHPPAGKAGCGYWTYLRVQPGPGRDGH